jgi:nuclear pore complex protein Nup107
MREGKSLHDLDQEDEYKIMEYIFAFIRAGDLNAARDFCLKIGQSWRAATLEGAKLFQDDNYTQSRHLNARTNRNQQELFKNEGNLNRDIWRLMVYKLIRNVRLS